MKQVDRNSLTKDAFQILWADMAWRKELASQRRPVMLGHYATEALLMAGWSFSNEVQLVDFFSIYREAMNRVDELLEECESGKFTDGLYFYNLEDFDADLREMKKFIAQNDL